MACQLPSKFNYLAFHLGVLATLSNPFEVGFNFAIEIQALAPSTSEVRRLLNDITTQLGAIQLRIAPVQSVKTIERGWQELTFCWRHSLHARFTPGCLRRSSCSSTSPSPLPGELSSPALSWVRFLPRPGPALALVGLVAGVYVLLWVETGPLFLARPDGTPGGRFMSRKGFV